MKLREQTKVPEAPKPVAPKKPDSIAGTLHKLMTFQQLSNARSRERVQMILEEAFT